MYRLASMLTATHRQTDRRQHHANSHPFEEISATASEENGQFGVTIGLTAHIYGYLITGQLNC